MICFPSLAQTGTGSISGEITSVENKPLELVSVSLLEIDKSTLTDINGYFYFRDIDAGKYTIQIQMLGLKEKKIPVIVKENENAVVDYKLVEENI